MKSLYYQFVNFIQTINSGIFMTIWLLLFACFLVNIMKFFKAYNGTQKKFEKLGTLMLALILLAIAIFLTYIRN